VVLRFTPIINFTYTFVFSNCVWLQRLTTFSQREGHAQSTRATLEMEPARPAPVSTRGSTSASHEKLANLQFQATASDFLLADSESQVQSLALVVKDLQEQLVSSQDSASRLSKIQVHLARHFGPSKLMLQLRLQSLRHKRPSRLLHLAQQQQTNLPQSPQMLQTGGWLQWRNRPQLTLPCPL
jgi:hypothetical protein